MRRTIALSAAAAIALAGSTAFAQAPPAAPTTVQLPTFRFFSVNTSVSVPDRGSVVLGGVSRAGDSSTSRGFGPLRSRAISSGRSGSTMSVHATIIDHSELDRAVLAEAARRRGAVSSEARTADEEFLSRNVGRGPIESVPPAADSVANLRRQAELRAAEREDELAALLAKAESLEAAGKPKVAKIYYEMLSRRATGDLKTTVQSRIARIDSANTATAASGRE